MLAVDAATRSGWALRVSGDLLCSGELDSLDEPELDEVVGHMRAHAQARAMPLVLVLENSGSYGRSRFVAALGASRERWLAAWVRAGFRRTQNVVNVYPISWRARVLGSYTCGMKREIVRPIEQAAAKQEVSVLRARSGKPPIELGEDEAAAILISRWGARAPQVGKVLPKRVRALSQPLPQLKSRTVSLRPKVKRS